MQSIPVQSWNFEHESVIRIGRSTDNHVILYSAVVSRHHVEIRKADVGWELVNLGANGTYLDGKRVTQVPVEDGVIIRLARSGPNVQIHVGDQAFEPPVSSHGEKTVGQAEPRNPSATAIAPASAASSQEGAAEPVTLPIVTHGSGFYRQTTVDAEETAVSGDVGRVEPAPCCQQFVDSAHLFCLECGKPLREIGVAGDYHLVKALDQDDVSLAYLAWKQGQTFILKTLLPNWMEDAEAIAGFEQEARQLVTLNHPALPKFRDVFLAEGLPYLVMEPIYGRSLDQVVLTDGPLPKADAIARIQEVCRALAYLHQHTPPILHQRIKPTHLIQPVHPAAPLVLTGFTPGRAIAPPQGKAEYVAPEQQQGHPAVESDLYALGPTLVYLLTGNSPDAFYAHREQGFRFYAEYVPGLTADLVAIIRKLTNPQPSERFTQAQEVSDVLQQVVESNRLG
jgi:serine/threonine-protein kinase